MKFELAVLAALLLTACGERKGTPPNSKYSGIDSGVNYVKNFFVKNNWNYPLHINSCDTCLVMKHYVAYIAENRYSIAEDAFNQLSNSKLEIDSNVAYRLSDAVVYKDSNEIHYSIFIEKYKNNIRRDCCSEGWGYIDSNRIMISSNRAVFRYKKSRLTFLSWLDW